MQYERQKLIQDLKQSVCEVTFVKVNGDERVMRCTLDATHIPRPVDFNYIDEQHSRKENENVVAVWDINAGGWRSFRVASVSYIQQIDSF